LKYSTGEIVNNVKTIFMT